MSPSVSIDSAHTRLASTNGGEKASTASITKSGGMDGARGTQRVYPHIEDLTNVRPDVDINSPIRKILQDAEALAKQADTLLDFHRPDFALREYIKASIIAAEIIPRHKDYPSLVGNYGDLHRAHTGLMKRIKAQDTKFDAVIKTIRENNLRHGVHPTRNVHSKPLSNGVVSAPGVSQDRARTSTVHINMSSNSTSTLQSNNGGFVAKAAGTPSNGTNGAQVRNKPIVQPKPEGLHGKVLQTSHHTSAQSPGPQVDTDLAARFARLRSLHPQNAIQAKTLLQDSRIRTQPILIPSQSPVQSTSTPRSGRNSTTVRPAGPREFPSVPSSIPDRTKIALDVQIPAMPKPPDAIYSPAGSADATSINLPSSASRKPSYPSSSHSAAPPISKVMGTPSIPDSTFTDPTSDYFPPTPKVDNPISVQQSNKRNIPQIPHDASLSAEKLVDYLALGSQTLRLLLVDLRSREEFDKGHIMSQSIVCIEPITIREGMSAEDIGESIVLSPDLEQRLYDKRHEFDIVVFYDQSSVSLDPGASGPFQGKKYLGQFSKAIYDYGYDKQLRRPPILLRGGLDAWIDLMGPGSLKTSSTNGAVLKPARPLGRVSIARDLRRNLPRSGARQSRPFSKEEETKWDETIKDEANNKDQLPAPDGEEFSYARTTEDFFRKYPELPSIQESMISTQPRSTIRDQHNEFDAVVPRPPARPAPALPRQRSSGISEKGPSATYAMTSASNSITPLNSRAGLTGLNNVNAVTCYVNSIIQCLSATPAIRQYLLNKYTHPQTPHPPPKGDEQGSPPQLLTRNLTNLLRILWSGQYDWIYVNALYAKKIPYADPRNGLCGTARQHDAHEFLGYIFDVILDELNVYRDKTDYQLTNPDPKLQRLSTIQSCIQEWKRYQESHHSALSNKFAGLVCESLLCSHCPYSNRQFTRFEGYYTVYFPPKYHRMPSNPNPPARVGIKDLLEDTMNFGRKSEIVDEWKCETCGNLKGIKSTKFAYLPEYLVLHFSRFGADLDSSKVKTHIDLSSPDIDMGPFHITANDDVQSEPGSDAGFHRLQKYEAYAAAMHQGNNLEGGHYVALTRNPEPNATGDAKQWHIFNDRHVQPGSFKDLESQGFSVAVLFLRRKS